MVRRGTTNVMYTATAGVSPAGTQKGGEASVPDSPFIRFMEFRPPSSPTIGINGVKPGKTAAARIEERDRENDTPQRGNAPPRKSALRNTSGVSVQKPAMTSDQLAAAVNELKMLKAGKPLAERDVGSTTASAASIAAATRIRQQKERERARAMAAKVKKPTPPSNVFIWGLNRPGDSQDGGQEEESVSKACAAPDWEALPAGTKLSVWWAGNSEYYECTILDWHVAIAEDKSLFYTHRCQYDGGVFDHDLAKCQFEVIEVPANLPAPSMTPRGGATAALPLAPVGELLESDRGLKKSALNGTAPKPADDMYASNYQPLSPKRRWLAKQESQLEQFEEELEQGDIGTPMRSARGGEMLRGRLALRRIQKPLQLGGVTPRTPRAADCPTPLVNPSDKNISYRLPALPPSTPIQSFPALTNLGTPIGTPQGAARAAGNAQQAQ